MGKDTLKRRYEGISRTVKLTVSVRLGTLTRLEGIAHTYGISRSEAVDQALVEFVVRKERHLNRQDRISVEKAMRAAMDMRPVEEVLEDFRSRPLTDEVGSAIDGLRPSPSAPARTWTAGGRPPKRASMTSEILPQQASPKSTEIADRRRQAGLSQQQLAEHAECSISSVKLFEGGYVAPRSVVRRRIEQVLSELEEQAA